MIEWRVKHGFSEGTLHMEKTVSFSNLGNPEKMARVYAQLVNDGEMDAPGTRSWDAVVEYRVIDAWTRA